MTPIATRTRRVVSALALMVAGGLSLGIAPAAVLPVAGAATCTTSGGVSVVVDFRELGGSTVSACAVDGGGKSAAAIFDSVGVTLSYAQRQPGFVCRVNGAPASDPCVNASPVDAYWGLWWADGSRASWTYSSSSVGGLTVPAGGSVAWSWQQDRSASGPVAPGVAPPVIQSSPSPTPTASPTATPTSGGGSSQPSPTASPTASPTKGGGSGGTPTANPTSGSASPTKSPSTSPSDPTEEPTLASESPSDSSATGDASDGPLASESPGDSSASSDPSEGTLGLESPTDSSTTDESGSGAEGEAAADEPTRIPGALTWGIVGLLGIGIVVSAVIARRRRVTDAS